jgi:hypothetical protein
VVHVKGGAPHMYTHDMCIPGSNLPLVDRKRWCTACIFGRASCSGPSYPWRTLYWCVTDIFGTGGAADFCPHPSRLDQLFSLEKKVEF